MARAAHVEHRRLQERIGLRLLPGLGLGTAALLMALVLLCSPAHANLSGFPDVPTSHPHYVAITDLAVRHIINGYSNGHFGPDDPVTRQQFAKMIVLSAPYNVGEGDVCAFTDVETSGPGSLYPDNYVAVAAAHGITVGTAPGLFSPGNEISRYQVITMVVRTADALDPKLLPAPPATYAGAAGWGDSSTHSQNARRAEYNGLLAGLSVASLDPWGDMTRAEVAQVLHNLLNIHFQDLGGSHTSAPAAVSRSTNRIDLFTLGQNHGLWHDAWNGSEWSGWEPHGGSPLTYDPVAVSWGTNRLDIFARGQDGAIWHISRNGASWGGWETLNGVFVSAPSVVSWGANRLDVFTRGWDNHLSHNAWNGSAWSGWQDLGGDFKDDPVAVSWGAGRIDVFARGQDDAIWHRALQGALWSGWESLGGALSAGPGAVSWGAGRLDVFARGMDNGLYHRSWDISAGATWSGWEALGGTLTSDPVTLASGAGRLDVFVRAQDEHLWHRSLDGATWSGWEWLGGPITSRPSAVSPVAGRVDVFALGNGDTMLHRWWDGAWRP
jgi:hypothetical protein